MGVNQICSSYGYNNIDPQKIDADKSSDLPVLIEISTLLEMYASANKIKGLAEPKFVIAKNIYSRELNDAKAANPIPKIIEAMNATLKWINEALADPEVRDKDKLSQDRDMLEKSITDLPKEMDKYKNLQRLLAFSKNGMLAKDPEEMQPSALSNELFNVLRELGTKLNKATRDKIGIGSEGWRESESIKAKLNQFVKNTCNSAKIGPAQAGPAQKPAGPGEIPFIKKWEIGGRVGGGYSSASGNGGPAGQVGGALKFKISPELAAQLDYLGQLATGNNYLDGGNNYKKSRSASDAALLSIRRFKSDDQWQAFFQLGYYRYRNYTDPSVLTMDPDRAGMVQNGRVVIPLSKKLDLSITERAFYGEQNGSSQAVIVGEPVLVANLGPVHPYAGPIVGYDRQQNTVLGGFGGVSVTIKGKDQKDEHEINLRVDQSKAYGTGVRFRYFYGNVSSFGIGPSFNYNSADGIRKIAGGLNSIIPLMKDLALLPYIQGGQISDQETKRPFFELGIAINLFMIPAIISGLRPNRTDPLPEVRRWPE